MKNPYEGQSRYNSRFDSVMSKLWIWNLTQYETLVFLDADTLIFQNVDELFECGEFCAAFLNPYTFNSGVLVLKPSRTVFEDMMHKVTTGVIKSYDGGDQGFLNTYFPQLISAPMFDSSKKDPTLHKRLSSLHHTDHVLYYPRLRWDVIAPKIIQFVGVPMLKPWLWWSYPIMDLSSVWLEYRQRLPIASSDGGHIMFNALLLFIGGVALFTFAFTVTIKQGHRLKRFFCRFLGSKSLISESPVSNNVVSLLGGTVGVILFFFSAYIGFKMIPPSMPPNFAWPLFFLWTYAILFLTFGSFCWLLRSKEEVRNSVNNASLMWGYALFVFSLISLSLSFKRGIFVDIFTKLGVLFVGLVLLMWAHFLVLSRIAFLWYIGDSGSHGHKVGSSHSAIFVFLATLIPALYLFS